MNQKNIKKLTTYILILSTIAMGVVLPINTKKAEAQIVTELASACVGGFIKMIAGDEIMGVIDGALDSAKSAVGLGVGKVPVDDSETQKEVKKSSIERCLLSVKEIAVRMAREVLKKQLLDQIVDQTITWIQDGTQPKFVENFGEFFDDAVNAGVGETIREIGLGDFCDSPVKARIEINLQAPPKFHKAASCTLDDVVGNIAAFKDNFKNGGWIGIQSAAAPENNRHGIYLLAMEETINEAERQDKIAQAKIAGGGGYLPQEVCTAWVLLDELGRAVQGSDGGRIYEFSDPARKPTDPPALPANIPEGVTAHWECDKTLGSKAVTPSKTVGDTVSKAINADIDYILSADELEAYASAILDAAINRMTKNAVSGLIGLTTKSETDRITAINNVKSSYSSAVKGETIREGAETGARGQMRQQASGFLNLINQASTTLNSVITTNKKLILALDNANLQNGAIRGLTQCLSAYSSYVMDPESFSATQTLIQSESRRDVWIPEQIEVLKKLRDDTSTLVTKLQGEAYDISLLSPMLFTIQSDINTETAIIDGTLSDVTALVSVAEKNRDRCNMGE